MRWFSVIAFQETRQSRNGCLKVDPSIRNGPCPIVILTIENGENIVEETWTGRDRREVVVDVLLRQVADASTPSERATWRNRG